MTQNVCLTTHRHPACTVGGYWQTRDAMFDVTSCWDAVWRLYRHVTCLPCLLPWRGSHRRRPPGKATSGPPPLTLKRPTVDRGRTQRSHCPLQSEWKIFRLYAYLIDIFSALWHSQLQVRNCSQRVTVSTLKDGKNMCNVASRGLSADCGLSHQPQPLCPPSPRRKGKEWSKTLCSNNICNRRRSRLIYRRIYHRSGAQDFFAKGSYMGYASRRGTPNFKTR